MFIVRCANTTSQIACECGDERENLKTGAGPNKAQTRTAWINYVCVCVCELTASHFAQYMFALYKITIHNRQQEQVREQQQNSQQITRAHKYPRTHRHTTILQFP